MSTQSQRQDNLARRKREFEEFQQSIQAHCEKLDRKVKEHRARLETLNKGLREKCELRQKEIRHKQALEDLYGESDSKDEPPGLEFNWELAALFQWLQGLDLDDLNPRPTLAVKAMAEAVWFEGERGRDWPKITEAWNEIMGEDYMVEEVKACLSDIHDPGVRMRVSNLVWSALFLAERTSLPK